MSLARCEELLIKIQKGDQAALDELMTLAHGETPNPHALTNLGICYHHGIMVAKSSFTAASYYRNAIKQGCGAAAYHNLAVTYLYEQDGHKKDPNEAATLFFNAAQLKYIHAISELKLLVTSKNTKAMTYLGLCYENNYCVPADINTAISYYRQAAKLGDDAALCHLARLQFKEPKGIPDIIKGVYLYLDAAIKNTLNPEGSLLAIERLKEMADKECAERYYAAYMLGLCYYHGHTVQKNHAEAFRYISLAAPKGTDEAKKDLGVLHRIGEGTCVDISLFAFWSLEAAKENTGNNQGSLCAFRNLQIVAKDKNPSVLHALALCHHHGYSTPQNYVESKKIFESAALLHHGPSCYQLGLMFQQGLGVDKNLKKASDYFYLAAQYYNAKDREENLGLQKLEELAATLAEFPLANIQYNLGNCYRKGYAVNKDTSKSLQFYYRSAELHYRCMLINWSGMSEKNINMFAENLRAILALEIDLVSSIGLDLQRESEALLISPDRDQTRQLFTIMMTLKAADPTNIARETREELKKFDHPAAQRLTAGLQRMQQLNEGLARVMKRYKTYLLNLKETIKQKIDNNEFLIWRFGAWRKGAPSHAWDIMNSLRSLNAISSDAEVLSIRDKIYSCVTSLPPNPERHPSSI